VQAIGWKPTTESLFTAKELAFGKEETGRPTVKITGTENVSPKWSERAVFFAVHTHNQKDAFLGTRCLSITIVSPQQGIFGYELAL
jgi:hypothetical protein